MRRLERDGVLDRELEGLPTSREVRRRLDRGEGLTTPELSVLLAWTKIVLAEELLDSDLPDDPYLDIDLQAYFPTQMREGFEAQIGRPPAAPRDHRDPGRQRPGQRRRHDLLAAAGGGDRRDRGRADPRQLRGPGDLRLARRCARSSTTLDNVLDAAVQTRMRLEMRTLVERASRWLVNNRRPPLDSQATVEHFARAGAAGDGRSCPS